MIDGNCGIASFSVAALAVVNLRWRLSTKSEAHQPGIKCQLLLAPTCDSAVVVSESKGSRGSPIYISIAKKKPSGPQTRDASHDFGKLKNQLYLFSHRLVRRSGRVSVVLILWGGLSFSVYANDAVHDSNTDLTHANPTLRRRLRRHSSSVPWQP